MVDFGLLMRQQPWIWESYRMNRPGFCGGCWVKEGHQLKPVWRLDSSIVPQLLPEGYTRWVQEPLVVEPVNPLERGDFHRLTGFQGPLG